jgi:hypothetical protein
VNWRRRRWRYCAYSPQSPVVRIPGNEHYAVETLKTDQKSVNWHAMVRLQGRLRHWFASSGSLLAFRIRTDRMAREVGIRCEPVSHVPLMLVHLLVESGSVVSWGPVARPEPRCRCFTSVARSLKVPERSPVKCLTAREVQGVHDWGVRRCHCLNRGGKGDTPHAPASAMTPTTALLASDVLCGQGQRDCCGCVPHVGIPSGVLVGQD